MNVDWSNMKTKRFVLEGQEYRFLRANRFTVTFAQGNAVTVTMDKKMVEQMLWDGDVTIIEPAETRQPIQAEPNRGSDNGDEPKP